MNNINVSSFDQNVEQGERAEHDVLKSVQKKYPKAFKKNGHFKEYDIFVPEVGIGIEVKDDSRYSSSTGNFFIEYEFNGKPSGISATQAQWWVQLDKEHMYWVPTETLEYWTKSAHKGSWTGKDGTVVKGYLLSKDKFFFSPYVKVISRTPKLL